MSKKLLCILLTVLVVTLATGPLLTSFAIAQELDDLSAEEKGLYQALKKTVNQLGGEGWFIWNDFETRGGFPCFSFGASLDTFDVLQEQGYLIGMSVLKFNPWQQHEALDRLEDLLENPGNNCEEVKRTTVMGYPAVIGYWESPVFIPDEPESNSGTNCYVSVPGIVWVQDTYYYCHVSAFNYARDVQSIAEILSRNIGSVTVRNNPPIASFDIFPPNPTPDDSIALVSTSTDPENDPLTFEWYVDGRYDSDFPSCELGMLEAGKYEITLKVTDSHDNTTEITRVIEVAESAYTFKLWDEQMVLYDFNDSYPIVTLELKGMNWQELGLLRIGNVAVTFNLQLTGTNNLGSFRWPADGPVSRTILLQYLVRYMEGGPLSGDDPYTIELTIPLYYILRDAGWLDLDENPRFYLSRKHLALDSDDWGTVDFGYADSPPSPLGPYAIHPGMENQPREPDLKVYREQYIAVWEGTLKVIDEDSGVGIYAGDALEELICKPAAWCRGRGTEYDIEVTPGEGFRVNVVEGQVDVVNRNMVTVETLNAGSGEEYSSDEFLANEHPIADFAIAPEKPTTEDIVLITSLSTDADGDPLTYSWYVDGKYYAQASNSDGIVLENLEPGKHDIKLIVEDGWGGQGEYSATVVIGGDRSFNVWTIIWIAAGAILFLLVLKGLRGKRKNII